MIILWWNNASLPRSFRRKLKALDMVWLWLPLYVPSMIHPLFSSSCSDFSKILVLNYMKSFGSATSRNANKSIVIAKSCLGKELTHFIYRLSKDDTNTDCWTEILQQTTLILNLLTMCEFLVYFSRQFAWNKPELFYLLVGRVDGWLSLCHFQPLL